MQLIKKIVRVVATSVCYGKMILLRLLRLLQQKRRQTGGTDG